MEDEVRGEAAERAGRSEARRPRILLSNDDGYDAPGIRAAAVALADLGELLTVAPDREQSAASHALTMRRPIRLFPRGEKTWSVDGTPTDCVMLAVHGLFRDHPPDLVVSGINHGPNLGEDVLYSGTVAAAFEGHVLGIPSLAVSVAGTSGAGYPAAAAFLGRLAASVLADGLPPGTLLNVNVPDLASDEIRGQRVTRLGKRVYEDVIVKKTDPRGRDYYWIGGRPAWADTGEATDRAAVEAGYVSLTPLQFDLTDHRAIGELAGRTF